MPAMADKKQRSPQEAEAVRRHCLEILAPETIEIRICGSILTGLFHGGRLLSDILCGAWPPPQAHAYSAAAVFR